VIIVLCCLIVFAVEAAVLRRRIAKLLHVSFRGFFLVWLALVDQILVISVLPSKPHIVLDVANLLSYAAAAGFVWLNRRIPGLLLVGAGGALNLIAIGSNGGTMPASAAALRTSGWRPAPGHFVNSGVVSHPKLAFLGDVFATPKWFPAHDVFSIGDVLIVVAVTWLIYRVSVSESPAAEPEDEGAPVRMPAPNAAV
jgi:Family of unknown function (DUF5317)